MPFPLIAVIIAIASIALNVISALLRPKTSDRPEKDWEIPTTTEGRSVPVVWGTDLQRAPNIIWWGDTKEVRRNNIWRYFTGIAWALAHGAPVLRSIIVNEKVIWTGTLTDGQTLFLDYSNLFGATGGGIVWDLKYYQGNGTTGADPYLASQVPDYPDHRRLAYLVSRGPAEWTPGSNWKGFIGNSPNLPTVEFELQRFPSGLTPPPPPAGGPIHTLNNSTTQIIATPPEWETSDHWRCRGDAFTPTDGWNNTDKYFQATKSTTDATVENGFSTFPGSPYIGLPNRPNTISFEIWVNYLPPHSGRIWVQLSGTNSISCTIPNELLTANAWTEITIPLTTSWPWRINNAYTGPLATQAQIDARAKNLVPIQGVKIVISNMLNVPQGNFTARLKNFWFDKTGGPPPPGNGIGGDANPIWILYEALTNEVWGCGVDPADGFEGIDNTSFQDAADQVQAEGLGASYILQESMQFPRLADMILRHVDAVLYREPTNGKWTVKLIRDDYNPTTLPVLDEKNIMDVQEFGLDVSGVLRDVVRIKFIDRTKQYKDSVATFRNPAVRAIQGYSSAAELDFPMVRDPGVAQRIAEREALGYSYPLRRLRVVATREAASLRPGSAFKFSWADYAVAGAIFRVTSVRLGSPADGAVIVEAVEDKFALASGTIGVPPVPAPPIDGGGGGGAAVQNLAAVRTDQLPYYYAQTVMPRVSVLAVRGATTHTGYDLDFSIASDPLIEIQQDRKLALRTTTITPLGGYESDGHDLLVVASTPQWAALTSRTDAQLRAGAYLAYLGDELVQFSSVTPVTGGLRLNGLRHGLLDTTPRAHPAGTEIWLVEQADNDSFAVTNTAGNPTNIRARAREGSNVQPIPTGITDTENIASPTRAAHPSAPRDIRVNGNYRTPHAAGSAVFTWKSRNRFLESEIIPQTDSAASLTEPSTLVRIRIYDETNTLVRTINAFTGTLLNYTETDMILDFGYVPDEFRIVIEGDFAGSIYSWQSHDLTIEYVQ